MLCTECAFQPGSCTVENSCLPPYLIITAEMQQYWQTFIAYPDSPGTVSYSAKMFFSGKTE